MGKHLKRLAAPRAWKLGRKEATWTAKPAPGPHGVRESLPLLLVVRDILKYAATNREAKRILNEGKITVDKKVRKAAKFPVGLMDILEVPTVKARRIMLIDEKGKLALREISEESAKAKLCRIQNKTLVKGGAIQLNLHDGRNILLKKEEAGAYKAKDTILLDLESGAIKARIPFKVGALAFITGGAHKAKVAKIEEIHVLRSPEPNVVTLGTDEGKFQTVQDYVFPVGEGEPAIPEFKRQVLP